MPIHSWGTLGGIEGHTDAGRGIGASVWFLSLCHSHPYVPLIIHPCDGGIYVINIIINTIIMAAQWP